MEFIWHAQQTKKTMAYIIFCSITSDHQRALYIENTLEKMVIFVKAVSKVIIASVLLFSVNCFAEDEVYAIPDELHAVFKENGFKDVDLEDPIIRGSSLVIILLTLTLNTIVT